MQKVAALVSGGVDSIYAAYDRAARGEDALTVVHFNFGTSAEYIACMRWAAKGAADWISGNVRPICFLEVPTEQYWTPSGLLRQVRAKGWWATELIYWAA